MRLRFALRLWWVLVCLGFAVPAHATTLAVLPLERADRSEAHEGFGQAIAGMLVADLSHVDGLTLVERARLDALLGEIALGKSNYLDPKTAQKVGKGVGAELVLVGDWSTLDGELLLDARIVDVSQGTVREAVAANGTVDDFVSVEKQLVTELIDGLDLALSASARRQIWSAAPTERFDAFVAYSEGLHAEDAGAWEQARAAYERALARDPTFTSAQKALSALRATLEASEAAATSRSEAVQSAALQAVLAAVPDERQRPAGFVHDPASRAAFALRTMALENAGRSCQRFEEMLAFGEHTGWDVDFPSKAWDPFRALVEKTGFVVVPRDVTAPDAAHDSPTSRVQLFRSLDRYVTGDNWFGRPEERSGMAAAVVRCYPPAERVAVLDRMRASLEHADKARVVSRGDTLSVGERLVLVAAWQQITYLGPDATVTARMKGLLDAHPDGAAHATVKAAIDQVMGQATRWEDHQVRRQGRPPAALERVERALASRDASVLVTGDPTCMQIEKATRPGATQWVARLPDVKGDRITEPQAWDTAGTTWAILATLGCIRGQPARFADTDALASFLRAGLAKMDDADKQRSTCAMSVSMLEQMLQPSALERARSAPAGEAMWAYGVLITWYGSLQYQRCVDDRVP